MFCLFSYIDHAIWPWVHFHFQNRTASCIITVWANKRIPKLLSGISVDSTTCRIYIHVKSNECVSGCIASWNPFMKWHKCCTPRTAISIKKVWAPVKPQPVWAQPPLLRFRPICSHIECQFRFAWAKQYIIVDMSKLQNGHIRISEGFSWYF